MKKNQKKMKKIVLITALLLLAITAEAQSPFRRTAKPAERRQLNIEQVVSGASVEQVIKHKGFTVSYNNVTLIPNWVAYELTSEEASAAVVSRTDEFLPDPDVIGRQADTRDYSNSGFDRGHMAPAADMKWDKDAMVESFYMTNICPQDRGLNAGLWLETEQKCRYWAKKYGRVWVVCGPVFTSMHFKPIGQNRVAVPDAFFKCVCMYAENHWTMVAIIIPNLDVQQDLNRYMFPVIGFENIIGHQIFNNVPVGPTELQMLKSQVIHEDWNIPNWKKK